MAKAAYYPFFHGPGTGTTKMVWILERETNKRSRTPNTYQVTIYISPLDVKLVLHRSRCEYLVEGSHHPGRDFLSCFLDKSNG